MKGRDLGPPSRGRWKALNGRPVGGVGIQLLQSFRGTFEASGDAEGTAAGQEFWVRREDAPASSAQPFGTAEEVEQYLAEFPDIRGAAE